MQGNPRANWYWSKRLVDSARRIHIEGSGGDRTSVDARRLQRANGQEFAHRTKLTLIKDERGVPAERPASQGDVPCARAT
jgi:hypothetical protein